MSFLNPRLWTGISIAFHQLKNTINMTSQSKNYGKSHNVGYHFDNYPNKKKEGRVKISLVVNLTGKKEYYPILPEAFMYRKYWKEAVDPETGQRLGHNFIQSRGNRDYESVFPVIAEAKAEMEALIHRLLRKKETLTHTTLRRRWNRDSDVLHTFLLRYVHEEIRRMEPSTFSNYMTMVKKVEMFDPDIKLAEVTWEWLRDFQNWMLNDFWNERKGEHGLMESSVACIMQKVGTVFRRAKMLGMIEEDPYYHFKGLRKRARWTNPTPNPLTAEEVLRLDAAYQSEELKGIKLTMSNGRQFGIGDRWHRYLQLILFSVYSGVRYSDLKRFNDPKNFKILKAPTGKRIHFRMKKSKKDHAILITQRLESVMTERDNGCIFMGKVPDSTTLNRQLKLILAHLGLDARHKWHDLRATFANLIRDLSEDEFGASKAMGHSKLATTQAHYFNSNNPQADKAVAALDKLGKTGPDLPDPDDFIYELRLIKMLNPGMKLTPRAKQWLASTDDDGGEESVVVPFGVAK